MGADPGALVLHELTATELHASVDHSESFAPSGIRAITAIARSVADAVGLRAETAAISVGLVGSGAHQADRRGLLTVVARSDGARTDLPAWDLEFRDAESRVVAYGTIATPALTS